MERTFFILTIIVTVALILGFTLGRYGAPVKLEVMPCLQQTGKIAPLPSFILLSKSEKQSFWDKLAEEI